MDKWKFIRWCNTAAGKIRYFPDWEMVTQELWDHLEDRYDSLIAAGFSDEEAVEKALDAMGSAEEIAPQLAAVHRPYWGWFYSFTKFLLILSLLFPLLTMIINTEIYPAHFDFWSPQWCSYDPYEDTRWENRTKLVVAKPNSVWKSDGYDEHCELMCKEEITVKSLSLVAHED